MPRISATRPRFHLCACKHWAIYVFSAAFSASASDEDEVSLKGGMDENVSKWATGSGVAGMSISRSVTASFNGSQELDLGDSEEFPPLRPEKEFPHGPDRGSRVCLLPPR
jgi:hypothetical protein